MNFQALNEYVQIKPLKEKEDEGKIIVARITKHKAARGIVISKGEGRILADGTRIKIPVNAGDTVLFNPYLLQEIIISESTGEKIFIINATGIYGKFD